jgi:hypothetical protein
MKKITYFLLSALMLLSFTRSLNAQSGNILSFDGINDAVIIPNDAALSLTTGTIEAWIATSDAAAPFQGVFVKQFGFGLFVDYGKLITYDWNVNAVRSTNFPVADGKWHHICMSFQLGATDGIMIYIDGALKLTTTIPSYAPALHDMTIGSGAANAGGQFFHGFIDEAHLWNTIRTPTPGTLFGNELGLVAYYNFNQGSGNAPNSGVTTLIDLTTPANNGALTGFALTGGTSNWLTVLTPLPVELLSFKGTPQYESVKLAWTIDRSVNNKGFQIERLKSASGAWEILDFVADDAKKTAYEYVDNTSLLDQNVLYYRLRMIDNDGDEQLSKVVAVSTKGAKGLKVYPNIVTDGFLNLEITGKAAYTEGSSDYAIYNVYGQSVLNGKIGQQIDVSALTRGTYIVTIGTEKAKFIKQ